jgi:hypothetical protein
MSANPGNNGRRRYVCRRDPGNPHCGKTSISAQQLEEVVAEMIFAAVDGDALRQALRERGERDDGLVDGVRRDEEALEALAADYYVERVLSREEFLSARSALTSRLETSRAKLAKRNGHGVLEGFAGKQDLLREAWSEGTLEWRRAVIGALLDRLEISPTLVRGRGQFDPSRARPVWRY